MNIIIRSLIILFISALFVQCEKDNNPNSNPIKRYHVAYTIDYSNDTSETDYVYNSEGLVVRIGDISEYIYQDSLIKETVFDGQQKSYNYYYLNPEGLVKTMHQFEYTADPLPDNIRYTYQYKYNNNGYLEEIEVYGHDILNYKTSFIWKDENLDQRIHQVLGINPSDTYTTTTNFIYYQDTLNTMSFGQDYLGMQSRNLVKRVITEGMEASRYSYEFDSKMRVVKRTEIRTYYKKNNQHPGDFFMDTIVMAFGY